MATEYDSSSDNEDTLDIEIPDQVIDIKRIELSLGKLFEKKRDGTPRLFDSSVERKGESDNLKYRIPMRQRYGSTHWKLPEKRKLVESVFKGMPIQGITVSEQIGGWMDVEDGASRLSILQDYYNDGFEYCNKMFSELVLFQQRRFEQYMINIDVLSGPDTVELTPIVIDEVFQRLNCGKPLQDADRYYSMERISPLVAAALKLMKESYWDKKTMRTDRFGDKNRKILPEVCAIVATIAFGEDYTSTSSSRLQKILDQPIPEGFWDKIREFCAYYSRIIYRAEQTERYVTSQMAWYKTSKQLGFIMHDYLDLSSSMSLKQKEDMWVEFMTIARSAENFMYGMQTLWNGLPKGVRQNSLKGDFKKKLMRIREFCSMETRLVLCEKEGIEWN